MDSDYQAPLSPLQELPESLMLEDSPAPQQLNRQEATPNHRRQRPSSIEIPSNRIRVDLALELRIPNAEDLVPVRGRSRTLPRQQAPRAAHGPSRRGGHRRRNVVANATGPHRREPLHTVQRQFRRRNVVASATTSHRREPVNDIPTAPHRREPVNVVQTASRRREPMNVAQTASRRRELINSIQTASHPRELLNVIQTASQQREPFDLYIIEASSLRRQHSNNTIQRQTSRRDATASAQPMHRMGPSETAWRQRQRQVGLSAAEPRRGVLTTQQRILAVAEAAWTSVGMQPPRDALSHFQNRRDQSYQRNLLNLGLVNQRPMASIRRRRSLSPVRMPRRTQPRTLEQIIEEDQQQVLQNLPIDRNMLLNAARDINERTVSIANYEVLRADIVSILTSEYPRGNPLN